MAHEFKIMDSSNTITTYTEYEDIPLSTLKHVISFIPDMGTEEQSNELLLEPGPDVKDFLVAEQEGDGDISTFIILDGSDSSSSNAGGKIQAEIANGVDKLVPENFATGLENHLVLELVEGDDHVGPFITLETGTDNFLLQEDGRKNPINNIIVQPVGDNHYHEPRGDPHVDGDGHTPEEHREIALWNYRLQKLITTENTNASSV